MSRPPIYTDELAAEVCKRMAEGESLRQVCRDESMPCIATVMKWARENPAFAAQYREAREALLEHWAEEITEIADDGSNDWMERETKGGRVEVVVDREHVDRSKLRVHTRQWLLSKLLPKKYGDKLDLTHGGPGGGPIPIKHVVIFPDGGPGEPTGTDESAATTPAAETEEPVLPPDG